MSEEISRDITVAVRGNKAVIKHWHGEKYSGQEKLIGWALLVF
jgi:hypothetical protein